MNYPFSMCQAKVDMTLAQIVEIDKAFTENEALRQQVGVQQIELITQRQELELLCRILYIPISGDDIWIDSKVIGELDLVNKLKALKDKYLAKEEENV